MPVGHSSQSRQSRFGRVYTMKPLCDETGYGRAAHVVEIELIICGGEHARTRAA
jgi:hypothetical protein